MPVVDCLLAQALHLLGGPFAAFTLELTQVGGLDSLLNGCRFPGRSTGIQFAAT